MLKGGVGGNVNEFGDNEGFDNDDDEDYDDDDDGGGGGEAGCLAGWSPVELGQLR